MADGVVSLAFRESKAGLEAIRHVHKNRHLRYAT